MNQYESKSFVFRLLLLWRRRLHRQCRGLILVASGGAVGVGCLLGRGLVLALLVGNFHGQEARFKLGIIVFLGQTLLFLLAGPENK